MRVVAILIMHLSQVLASTVQEQRGGVQGLRGSQRHLASCADNEFVTGTSCSKCAAGSFTSGGTDTTRTSCDACPAGSSCDGTSVTSTCPAGHFAAGGASTCKRRVANRAHPAAAEMEHGAVPNPPNASPSHAAALSQTETNRSKRGGKSSSSLAGTAGRGLGTGKSDNPVVTVIRTVKATAKRVEARAAAGGGSKTCSGRRSATACSGPGGGKCTAGPRQVVYHAI